MRDVPLPRRPVAICTEGKGLKGPQGPKVLKNFGHFSPFGPCNTNRSKLANYPLPGGCPLERRFGIDEDINRG